MKNYSSINTGYFSVEVESLRGIMALSTLFGHFYLYVFLPQPFRLPPKVLATLMAGFFNPQPAVLLFFTISGLVLGRQLGKQPVNCFFSFIAYLCRRAFRLIPLMWASILFACILNYFKGVETSLVILYDNLILDNVSLNVPLWSLKVELYCSIFFPFLFWFFIKANAIWNALLFIALSVLSYFWQTPIFIQFLVFFHAGLLIDYINAHCKKNNYLVNPLLFMFFCVVFLFAPNFGIGSRNWAAGYWQSWVLPEILACSFILFFIIHNRSMLSSFLCLPPIRYLGKISFSIYLFHFPLLFFMLEKVKISSALQFIEFALSYLILVFIIATAGYHWIELPTNRFGKALSSWLSAKSKSVIDTKSSSNVAAY